MSTAQKHRRWSAELARNLRGPKHPTAEQEFERFIDLFREDLGAAMAAWSVFKFYTYQPWMATVDEDLKAALVIEGVIKEL